MKYKLLLLFMLVAGVCWGQERTDSARIHYCEVICRSVGPDYYVELDFGENIYTDECSIMNENGTVVKYRSLISAVKPLVDRGWHIEQQNTNGLNGSTCYFLMSKVCTDNEFKNEASEWHTKMQK